MFVILVLQLLAVGQCLRPEQSLADDQVQSSRVDAGDGVEAEVMLHVNANQEISMSDEGRAGVVQLVHQVSDCAGQVTAFVNLWGEAWTDIMELLLPQNSRLSQLIDLLTPALKKGRVEALAAMGAADRTKPNCATTLSLQQASPSMLLETTQALSHGMCKQVEEVHDIAEDIESTAEYLRDTVKGMPEVVNSVVCTEFSEFVTGALLQTITIFKQHIPQCTAAAEGGSLLQVEGTAEAMAQSLRLTESTCHGEASAFLQYAKSMVQHCKNIRKCTTTLDVWNGLDEASQKCIDAFSDYAEDSEKRLCA